MDKTEHSFLVHFNEIRKRLVICLFFFCFFFSIFYLYSREIFQYIVAKPLISIMKFSSLNYNFIYTSLPEVFLSYIKISLFLSIVICFPILFYHLWKFLEPGLYLHEKSIFIYLFTLSPILFMIGTLFAYYVILPNACLFFLSFNSNENLNSSFLIVPEIKISEYLNFFIIILFSFGICFETPLMIFLMKKMKVITSKDLTKNWKIAITFIAIISAFITPPDIFSMIMLLIPLVFLYIISIYIIKIVEINKKNIDW